MPDTRPVVSFALLMAASLSFAQQVPASAVQISTVSRTEVAPTVAVPGTVYSRNEVQITAGVAGQLVMVAEPGTVVEKGDYIARIDKRSLRLQRAEQEGCSIAPISMSASSKASSAGKRNSRAPASFQSSSSNRRKRIATWPSAMRLSSRCVFARSMTSCSVRMSGPRFRGSSSVAVAARGRKSPGARCWVI